MRARTCPAAAESFPAAPQAVADLILGAVAQKDDYAFGARAKSRTVHERRKDTGRSNRLGHLQFAFPAALTAERCRKKRTVLCLDTIPAMREVHI